MASERLKPKGGGTTVQSLLWHVLNRAAAALRVIVYGWDGTNYQAIKTDVTGQVYIANTFATQTTLAAIQTLLGGGLPAALVSGRLDTNIGSWLGSTAPTVGQKTMANSLPMVIASDQSNVPVTVSNSFALDATLAAMAADLGDSADAEATGNGSLIAITKRLRTLLGGGLPAALVSGRLDTNVGAVPTDPFGANADAASATGSISAKLKGIATALGVTALDLGSGTGGSRTLRLFQDTAQWVGGAGSVTAATQRITHASDDPTVTSLQSIDDIVGAIKGPGSPTIDSFTSAAINLSANTANQSIISAPGANKQIWIYGLAGAANVAGTISLQDEDDTAITGVIPVGITGGWVFPMSGNFAMPWKKVATNKAVEIDTVTCEFDGIVTYAIVSV